MSFFNVHSKFQSLHYLTTWSIPFCKPLTVSDPIAKSPANNNTETDVFPIIGTLTLLSIMKLIKAYVKILNKQGFKLQPCLILLCSTKPVTTSPPYYTQNLVLLYIIFTHSTILLVTPFRLTLNNKDSLSVESQAFSKSTKHQ